MSETPLKPIALRYLCIHFHHSVNSAAFPLTGSLSCRPCKEQERPECVTLPSACRLFSRNAISIRGGATTVLFKVCAKYLPSLPLNTDASNDEPAHRPDWNSFPLRNTSSDAETRPPRRMLFTFQIRQVAGAAFQRSAPEYPGNGRNRPMFCHRLIDTSILALFRLADNDHFLLFKLMNPVNAAFFNAVRPYFFTEARGIRWSASAEAVLHRIIVSINLPIMECSLVPIRYRSSPFDFIHHVFHLRKAHDAGHHVAANHKRRDVIGKAPDRS